MIGKSKYHLLQLALCGSLDGRQKPVNFTFTHSSLRGSIYTHLFYSPATGSPFPKTFFWNLQKLPLCVHTLIFNFSLAITLFFAFIKFNVNLFLTPNFSLVSGNFFFLSFFSLSTKPTTHQPDSQPAEKEKKSSSPSVRPKNQVTVSLFTFICSRHKLHGLQIISLSLLYIYETLLTDDPAPSKSLINSLRMTLKKYSNSCDLQLIFNIWSSPWNPIICTHCTSSQEANPSVLVFVLGRGRP